MTGTLPAAVERLGVTGDERTLLVDATLARLAAAEHRCRSFGRDTVVIDDAGLRLEVRMPEGAAGTKAAVLGLPDPPAVA